MFLNKLFGNNTRSVESADECEIRKMLFNEGESIEHPGTRFEQWRESKLDLRSAYDAQSASDDKNTDRIKWFAAGFGALLLSGMLAQTEGILGWCFGATFVVITQVAFYMNASRRYQWRALMHDLLNTVAKGFDINFDRAAWEMWSKMYGEEALKRHRKLSLANSLIYGWFFALLVPFGLLVHWLAR